MVAIVSEIIDWLRPAFEVAGYAIVPAAMFLESAAFVGILLPGDVILAVGGVYAARGTLALPWVIVIGTIAAIAGETTGYMLGGRYGARLISHLPFADRFAARIDRAEASMRRNAGRSIVLGRLLTGVAGTVPFAAGTAGIGTKTFLLYTVPTVTAWATAVVLVGYLVGNNVETIDNILSTFGWAVLGLLAAVLLARWGRRRWKEHRS